MYRSISRDFPFVTNGALGGVALVRTCGRFMRRNMCLSRDYRNHKAVIPQLLNGLNPVNPHVQLSSLAQYPFTLQYIRSMLPYAAWRHPKLIPIAHTSTWMWVLTYTASSLLYLVRLIHTSAVRLLVSNHSENRNLFKSKSTCP